MTTPNPAGLREAAEALCERWFNYLADDKDEHLRAGFLSLRAALATPAPLEDHGNPGHPMKQWDAGWQAAFAAIRSGDPDAIRATGLATPAPEQVETETCPTCWQPVPVPQRGDHDYGIPLAAPEPTPGLREALDGLWAEMLLDACASDGPIRDNDVRQAIALYRPKIEEALAPSPAPLDVAWEHIKQMPDRAMELHTRACLTRWVDVPGYGRMPAHLTDPFVCVCRATTAPLNVKRLAAAIVEALNAVDDEWTADELAEIAATEYARLSEGEQP